MAQETKSTFSDISGSRLPCNEADTLECSFTEAVVNMNGYPGTTRYVKEASRMSQRYEQDERNSEEERQCRSRRKRHNEESLIFIGTQGIYFTLEEITRSLKIHSIRKS